MCQVMMMYCGVYYENKSKTYGYLNRIDSTTVNWQKLPRIYTVSATELHFGFHEPTPRLPRSFTLFPRHYTLFPETYTFDEL